MLTRQIVRPWNLLSLGLLSAAKLVSAATIAVSPGPDTVQSAMLTASAGDTLLLQPGLYAMDESIDMRKPVVIISAEGPYTTVLDLQENFGSVIFIRPMTGVPTIEGFTIMGGAQIFTSSGAGIYSSNASPRIVNNLIIANGATDIDGNGGAGAGIAIFGGSPYIANNTLVGNVSGSGAAYLANCAGVFTHNIIAYNRLDPGSSDGFGLACGNAATNITDNIFWSNEPDQIAPTCSLVPPSAGNVVIDPQFCGPQFYPGSRLADWQVMTSGPTAPGHQYYGWGAGLPICASTKASPSTWGKVKALYRE